MSAADIYEHLIPLPEKWQVELDVLSKRFGGKAATIQMAIDWAIEHGMTTDTVIPSTPRIHPHLSVNYRDRFRPGQIGSLLIGALSKYLERQEVQPDPPRVWYWPYDLPVDTIRAIRRFSFNAGRHPDLEFATHFRAALTEINDTLPGVGTEEVEIPTDPETRNFYAKVAAECSRRGDLEVDTLIVQHMAAAARRIA